MCPGSSRGGIGGAPRRRLALFAKVSARSFSLALLQRCVLARTIRCLVNRFTANIRELGKLIGAPGPERSELRVLRSVIFVASALALPPYLNGRLPFEANTGTASARDLVNKLHPPILHDL